MGIIGIEIQYTWNTAGRDKLLSLIHCFLHDRKYLQRITVKTFYNNWIFPICIIGQGNKKHVQIHRKFTVINNLQKFVSQKMLFYIRMINILCKNALIMQKKPYSSPGHSKLRNIIEQLQEFVKRGIDCDLRLHTPRQLFAIKN